MTFREKVGMTAVLAYRCGYIDIKDALGKSVFTKKAQSKIPKFIWRSYDKLLGIKSKRHRDAMYIVLTNFDQLSKVPLQ